MKERIEQVEKEIEQYLITDMASLETYRIKFIGSKGITKELFSELKNVPNEEKRAVGQLLN